MQQTLAPYSSHSVRQSTGEFASPPESRHSVVEPSWNSIRAICNATQSLRIVALGDSVIYGFGDPDGGGWIERLRRRWLSPDEPGHILYNLGVRGDGVHQIAQRLELEFRHRGELRNRVPDIILLSVGINDSVRLGKPSGRNFTELDEFAIAMANLLDTANHLCPVIFVGMTPVDEARMPFSRSFYFSQTDQYHYKEATRLACLERNIPYLDIFDLWLSRGDNWWRSRLCCDGLHPNTLGYQSLLQDFLNWGIL